MELKLFSILFVLTISICNAQMNPITITFKSGEKLTGLGKKKVHTLKFKTDENAKAQEFDFSLIDSAEIETYFNKKIVYKFFQLKSRAIYIAVEELVSGKKTQLYTNSTTFSSGGMGIGNSTVTFYYIKKTNEDKLTELGAYSPLTNDFKSRIKIYFSDCKNLIEKLENREFKVREGLEKIVDFYNKNCQ